MDYEKAYKEALERAREMMASKRGVIVKKEALQTIFPELRESEDERIRKGLIEALKTSKTIGELKFTLPEPTREECIAYLEKQNDVPSRETTLGIWKLGNFWKENQVERDGLTQLQYIQKYLCLGLKNATIDYLKEQKPRKFKLGDKVHWHDDDTNVITITGFRDDAYLTDSAYGPILFCDEDNWERVEQKPVDWSEEDKRILKGIIGLIDHNQHYNVSNKEMLEWLKSLRPQGSKDSLQTHWKPSEEQMNCLKFACESRRERHNASVNGDAVFLGLTSLYNDLKKLM